MHWSIKDPRRSGAVSYDSDAAGELACISFVPAWRRIMFDPADEMAWDAALAISLIVKPE